MSTRQIKVKPGVEPMERLFARMTISPTGCWLHPAGARRNGYAFLSRKDAGGKWITDYAHRISVRFYKGTIPKGMHVDHLCRNRSCFNPDHLEVVTPKENVRRSILVIGKHGGAKRRTVCRRGHPFTPENTLTFPRWKECRICRQASKAVFYARQAARKAGE